MWKDMTCQTCEYKVKSVCRRFPHKDSSGKVSYPQILWTNDKDKTIRFIPACAEYQLQEGSQKCDSCYNVFEQYPGCRSEYDDNVFFCKKCNGV